MEPKRKYFFRKIFRSELKAGNSGHRFSKAGEGENGKNNPQTTKVIIRSQNPFFGVTSASHNYAPHAT